MADGIHPTGPSQPTLDQAYTTPGNPVQTAPLEKAQAQHHAHSDTTPIDHRSHASRHTGDGTFSSLGHGIRAPNAPGEEAKGKTHEDVGRHNELEAEQMAAPGEGKVAAAVQGKPGASGGQAGFESDLDRKKAEQAELRKERAEERRQEVDVGGVLGQRGGPANPVDRDGYPNGGS